MEPNTLYYVRAFAIHDYSSNYVYGDAISFTTPSRGLPTVTTGSANSIGPNVAAFENTVVDDGGSIITSRGLCWSANETLPSISDNKTTEAGTLGVYTSTMLDLLPNTTYHARAYAINEFGIVYGDPVSFTTTVPSDCGTITDVDGNTYTTIKIGNQCWMQQNLNTSRFKNGDDIGVVSGELWRFYPYYNSPAWCYYGNYGNGGDGGYGKLYNLKAVQDLRGLAPVGWHVATNEDWDVLANHLGGYSVAGGKMKSSSNWQAPNIDATNISGFNALPGGAHFFGYSSGTGYKFLSDGWGKSVSYWSFTGARGLSSSHSGLNKGEGVDGDVGYGFYVRCVKD